VSRDKDFDWHLNSAHHVFSTSLLFLRPRLSSFLSIFIILLHCVCVCGHRQSRYSLSLSTSRAGPHAPPTRGADWAATCPRAELHRAQQRPGPSPLCTPLCSSLHTHHTHYIIFKFVSALNHIGGRLVPSRRFGEPCNRKRRTITHVCYFHRQEFTVDSFYRHIPTVFSRTFMCWNAKMYFPEVLRSLILTNPLLAPLNS